MSCKHWFSVTPALGVGFRLDNKEYGQDGSACPPSPPIGVRAAPGQGPGLQPNDTIAMQGEVSRINDNGTGTVRLHGFDYPLTTRAEHLNLVAKRQPLEAAL
jgi:hypothetical protein